MSSKVVHWGGPAAMRAATPLGAGMAAGRLAAA